MWSSILICLCLLGSQAMETLEDFLQMETQLLQSLFKNYNADLPVTYTRVRTNPTVNPLPQKINITVVYANLLRIDEPNESISLSIDVYLDWIDFRLKWDPADFNGIDLITVPRNRVWIPDLIAYDTTHFEWGIVPERQQVVIQHNGKVSLLSSAIISYNCELDITNFPFDVQVCAAKFAFYYSNDKELQLSPAFAPLFDERIMSSNAWTAIGKDIKNITFYDRIYGWNTSEINFLFKLRRSDTYYVVLIIIPSYVLAFLCIAGLFWSKITYNTYMEKLNLGYAGILAMVLVLQMTTQEMPKTSNIPILSLYTLMNLSSLTVASLTVLVTGKAEGKLSKKKKSETSWSYRILKKIHIVFLILFLLIITINLVTLVSKKGEVRNSE